jgi:ElaB/YqjD/DUF883 family membrane-anchored ribosome-binding protein
MNIFRRNAPPQSPSIYEADRAAGPSLRDRGNAVVNSATEFYRKNPKTVGTAALVGAAALLGFLKNRGLGRR